MQSEAYLGTPTLQPKGGRRCKSASGSEVLGVLKMNSLIFLENLWRHRNPFADDFTSVLTVN